MKYLKNGCLTFNQEKTMGSILMMSEVRNPDTGESRLDELVVQWNDDVDGDASIAINLISNLADQFESVSHAYDYFQIAPVPGYKGLTAREVIKITKRQGIKDVPSIFRVN